MKIHQKILRTPVKRYVQTMIKKIGESKYAEARHWSVDDALEHFAKKRAEKPVKKIIILYVNEDETHNYIVAGTQSKLETLGLLAIHQALQSQEALEPYDT